MLCTFIALLFVPFAKNPDGSDIRHIEGAPVAAFPRPAEGVHPTTTHAPIVHDPNHPHVTPPLLPHAPTATAPHTVTDPSPGPYRDAEGRPLAHPASVGAPYRDAQGRLVTSPTGAPYRDTEGRLVPGRMVERDDMGQSAGEYAISVAMPDGRQVQYPVSKTCSVMRGGAVATLEALIPGDKLELFGQPVVRITATEDPLSPAAAAATAKATAARAEARAQRRAAAATRPR